MPAHQQHLFSLDPPERDTDTESQVAIATVVFAAPPFGPYDYRIGEPYLQSIHPGQRLQVPLGAGNRALTGYCIHVETRRGRFPRLKTIKSIVDEQPLVSRQMLELTRWMADYYICHWGQVLDAVVPAGVRGQAGTREQLFLSVSTAVTARLTQLKLPPKQATALRVLAASPTPLTPQQVAQAANCTQGPINALRKKRLVVGERRRIQQADLDELAVGGGLALGDAQSLADVLDDELRPHQRADEVVADLQVPAPACRRRRRKAERGIGEEMA